MTGTRLELPGVKRYYEFPDWRFSPTDQVLLFNFKNDLEKEDTGIEIIAERFGKGSIAGARKLCHNQFSKQQWLVIEVLFASASVRREAIRYGVCYNNKQYRAITTCNQRSSCTAFSITGMPIQKQEEALKFAKQRVEAILEQYAPPATISSSSSSSASLNNSNKKGHSTKNNNNESHEKQSSLATTVLQIQHIWLHTNNRGIYNGCGTVILDGYTSSLKENRDGALARYTDAKTYPLMAMHIRHCRMYCSTCRTLNHHATEDCIGEQNYDFYDEEAYDHSFNDGRSSMDNNGDDMASITSSTCSTMAAEASYDVIDPFES
ncbi:hypothetical protein BDA99DRAFT_540145 [Phascolomyces articulosus]|uniref:Uncharacterized protein n=1 Tax=Phascolomyces articulosus TaxID=60185 RepID=A0AAD5K843_9FUNG|nr:hypothetical protein BDA99DRAFT_540145 [Phascolomyces articulosus]